MKEKALPTQAEQVMTYLREKGSINQVVATSLFGITRLAAVVYTLKKRGVNIVSISKKGVRRTNYAEYRLG